MEEMVSLEGGKGKSNFGSKIPRKLETIHLKARCALSGSK